MIKNVIKKAMWTKIIFLNSEIIIFFIELPLFVCNRYQKLYNIFVKKTTGGIIMNKLFKLVSTGVIAVTLSSTFAPTLVVLADDSASEVVSVQNSATILTDMETVI